MLKSKIIKIQSAMIAIIILLQIILPVFAIAEENQQKKITVSRQRVENTNILTIRDVVAKITNVRIVYGEKIEKSTYFLDEDRNLIEGKGENLAFEIITETEGIHEVKTSFDIRENCYEYTVFILDENKNCSIYNYSIEQNTIKINDVISSENNKKELTINVSDTASNISKIKIIKIQTADEVVDFTTQGIIIGENYNSKEVIEKYIVSEDGFYRIYAENEKGQSFTWTTRVVSENPITLEVKQDEEQKNKLTFNIQDKLFDVKTVKVAKFDINNETDWENVATIYPNDKGVKLEDLYCYVAEEGRYSVRVEDTEGISYVKTTPRIYFNEDNKPKIELFINKNNPNVVNIKATDNLFKIKEIKVAVGENLEIAQIQEEAINIEIAEGNVVETKYEIQDEAKKMYTIIVGEDGHSFLLIADFDAIKIIEEQPEQNEPEQNEPEQNEPEQNEPEQNEPEQNEPEQNEPEQNEPEQNEPEQNEPEQNEPEQNEPEQNEPEQNEPEQNEPEQNEPEQNEPEQNEPEQNEPEQNEPEQNEPEQNEPEQNEPEQNEPEQNEPEQNEPEQNEPEQNEPEQNEPEQNEPEQNEPEQNEPEQNEPEQNKPEEDKKDNTVSDKIIPQTGIQTGILMVIGALSINSIIVLRKFLKCK